MGKVDRVGGLKIPVLYEGDGLRIVKWSRVAKKVCGEEKDDSYCISDSFERQGYGARMHTYA